MKSIDNGTLLNKILIFIMGNLCFFISQIVLRIPLLNYLQTNASFSIFSLKYQALSGFLILVSAGVFEESFRLLFRKFLLKAEGSNEKGLIFFHNTLSSSIIFGLGHGICEAFYVIFLAGFGLSFDNYFLIFTERLLAVIFHICQTILIFKGFSKNKTFFYLILAIILHTLLNGGIYLVDKIGYFAFYGLIALFDFLYIFILHKKNIEEA